MDHQACYVHASLYRFTTIGARVIIKRFNENASRVVSDRTSWDITHDGDLQIFTLSCYSTHGDTLDELLRETVDRYVLQELEDAIEEDREPHVELFSESALDDTFDEDDVFSAAKETAENGAVVGSNPIAHVVQRDGMPGVRGKVAATQLSQLPAQLRARSTGVMQHPAADALSVVRTAQWDGEQAAYRDSGELGSALIPLDGQRQMDFNALLDELTLFPQVESLEHIRKEPQIPLIDASSTKERHWEFVGEQPRTNQWLAGMGETEQLDPNAAPEPSKDAIRYHQIDTQAQAITGRIRMPQGVSVMPSQGHTEDEPEQTTAQLSSQFAALLKPSEVSEDGSDESDEDTDSDEASPSNGVAGRTGFAALLGKGQRSTVDTVTQFEKSSRALVCTVPHVVLSDSASTADTTPQGSVPGPSSHETPATLDSFPTYERRYAHIDGIGLTGDAANQAKWEMENRQPSASISTSRPLRTKDQLMLARRATAVTDGSLPDLSAPMALNSPSGYHTRNAPLPSPSLTPATYAETKLGGEEPWAHKLVSADNRGRTGHLIDTGDVADTFRATSAQFPALPSQSDPSRRTPPTQVRLYSKQQASNGMQQKSTHPDRTHAEGVLIDLSESSAMTDSSATPTVRLPQHKALTPKVLRIVDGNCNTHELVDDEDTVVERLRPDVSQPPKRHTTMKQKAQNKAKKGKGGKAKASKTAAKSKPVLELPEPPPLPKLKKVPEPVSIKPKSSRRPIATSVEEPDDLQHSVFVNRVMRMVGHVRDEPTLELSVQFGMLLMHTRDTSTDLQAIPVLEMQQSLDDDGFDGDVHAVAQLRAVRFLARIATARQDAAHLLSIPKLRTQQNDVSPPTFVDAFFAEPPWTLECETLYEVEVVDIEKTRWLLTIRRNDGVDVDVDHIQAEPSFVYVHYPQHVWDARMQVRRGAGPKPTAALVEAATIFAKTFNTPEEAIKTGIPAIEADIPDIGELRAFTVLRVLAKRCFSQATHLKSSNESSLENGDVSTEEPCTATWRVSQIQDLILNINNELDGEPGLLAVAGTEAEMLERGRLWWEASLEVKDGVSNSEGELDEQRCQQTLHALERTLGEIVGECGLDDVGLGQYYGVDLDELPEMLQSAQAKSRSRKGTVKGRVRREVEDSSAYVPFW